MNIIENGRSEYQIVAPGRHYPAENLAARNLQEGLVHMTGVRLPVRWAHQRVADRPAILVGGKDSPGDADLWHKDGYEISPRDSDLILAGTTRRATHYAVFAFLETLGARFFGSDDIIYPRLDRVLLPQQAVRSAAVFGYRNVFYPVAEYPEWAIRWSLNVHRGRDDCWGANARAYSLGHSFAALVPPKKYFPAHPEYFSLVDGRRRDRAQQLCCTNPAVADAACETMARWIAANPHLRIFPVGMNDWAGWCECPDCAAADRREGGPTGQLLTLVNRVAGRFPDRILATLAYAWSIDPPREMHARDNVLIVFCHNEGCYTHALDECELNRKFIERLHGWKEKSRRMLVWDYFVNYHSYLMPAPNFRRIQRDFRTYRDLGIEAMFCQGSAVRGGQFEGLRQYILARLLWNPDRDARQMAAEWLAGVYGRESGGLILDYLLMLEKHVRDNNVHMRSFGFGQEIQEEIFTPRVLADGNELWDRAEAAATDGRAARKIFAARAPEMCSRLFHAGMKYKIEGGFFKPAQEPDIQLRDRFVAAAIAGSAAHLREDDGAPEDFGKYYGRSYKAVVLESPVLRLTAIPELGGRILSLVYRPAGLELMRIVDPVRFVNFGLYDAGCDFAVEQVWHGMGTRAAFKVVGCDAGSVTLETLLEDQLRIRICYKLDGSEVRLAQTVANTGDRPAKVAAYSHPEFSGEVFGDDGALRMKRPDGSWTDMVLNPDRREGRDLDFSDDQKPAGQWEITSADKSVKILETFDAPKVAQCVLMLSRRNRHVNLELKYAPLELPPGSSADFGSIWQIGLM